MEQLGPVRTSAPGREERPASSSAAGPGALQGVLHAHPDTFGLQARGYERLGHPVFGALEAYPPGHTRCFPRKRLLPDPRPSGVSGTGNIFCI